MEKYLKSKQEYIDKYDRLTVNSCRRLSNTIKDKDNPDITKDKNANIEKFVRDLFMEIQAGEMYLKKEETIEKWMEIDRKKDELYESAEPPEGVRCLTCRNKLVVIMKTLWSVADKEDEYRVLFMFECNNKCLPRRTFYDDGEELITKPNLCPKCDLPFEVTSEDDGIKMTTVYLCSKCQYTKTDEHIWAVMDDNVDENFATDRDRFCMSYKEASDYEEKKRDWKAFIELMKEIKKVEDTRKEKLKDNPKGFHLDDGAGNPCYVCGDRTPDGENWYDDYGIKCLVCQKAIDNGEIPPYVAKDKESWYEKYDFEHYFNAKTPTVRKWIKDGILKNRIVSRYGQGVHFELFLIEDNKDFLPPKKLLESQTFKTPDGSTKTYPWYQLFNPVEHLKDYKIMNHLRVVPAEEMTEREKKKKHLL